MLGFECENCISATCQFFDIQHDAELDEIEVFSVEILLTTDCTITIGDEIQLCLLLNTEICERHSLTQIRANGDKNSLSELSVMLYSPELVSAQCMVYTIYNDIQSDIGVNDIASNVWYNQHNQHDFGLCDNYCTFTVK